MGSTKFPWIMTVSSRVINPLQPNPDDIEIEDIAHALSNLCRFTGHCPDFYSVAQHSVLVSLVCNPIFAKEALLHDATEAYLNDINTPVKQNLPDYQKIEEELYRCIMKKYSLSETMPEDVDVADKTMFRLEIMRLFKRKSPLWNAYIKNESEYVTAIIKPVRLLTPHEARSLFLVRYAELFEAEVIGENMLNAEYE